MPTDSNDSRWPRVEALLDELLDLSPEEQARRLDRLSKDEADICAQLERLLAADRAGGGLLDEGVAKIVGRVLDPSPPSVDPIGTRIGPYRILGTLGRGGMGEVFLAERASGEFEQQVALKVVRSAWNRAENVERFHRERAILAQLKHPNIATLLDGGTTDDGVPWFAMELVDGERITDWCDARRLDVAKRIALFDAVCRAVEYAHRNLVVHRDLKPGNVFVTDDGTVKLLDFGVGKLLTSEDVNATQTTRAFFTPAFAAPEQIRGDATSTASDVFSLGMLLYVLLTGHHPHGDTSRSSELARAIAEDDPPEASTLAGRGSATKSATELAELRRANASQLRRRLKGDLDNILRMALRKDPEARYASVRELREDLERHLNALPVHARAATRRYRLKKFVRRHRVATVAVAVSAVAILAGGGGAAWQASVAARERDRAGAVKDYLIEVFSAVDPAFESGENLTAAQLVERGVSQIEERFQDAPAIRAEISLALGSVLVGLAHYETGTAALTDALRAYEALGDRNGTYEALRELGDAAKWQGESEAARARYADALTLAKHEFGPDDPRAISVVMDLAGIEHELGRYDRAGELFHDALDHAQRVFGAGDVRVAPYHLGLAVFLQDVPDLPGAEAELRTAIRAYQASNTRGVELADALQTLGQVRQLADRSDESESVLREAIAIYREEYGDYGHPQLGHALNLLAAPLMQGNLAEASGPERLAEAEACEEEALDIFRRTLGPDHWMVAKTYSDLSVVKSKQGDIVEAGELLAKSVRLLKAALGDRHPALGAALSNLARSYMDLERYEESEETYDEAISLAREVFGERHVNVSHPLQGYAELCAKIGRYDDALRAATEACDIRREAFGETHSLVVETRVLIGKIEAQAGEAVQATQTLDAAIEDARHGLPLTQTVLASALVARADHGAEVGDALTERETFLEEALAIREDVYGADDARCVELREALAALRGGGPR